MIIGGAAVVSIEIIRSCGGCSDSIEIEPFKNRPIPNVNKTP